MRSKLSFLIVIVTVCAASLVHAQDDSWRFNITPYLWLPSIDTELRIAEIPLDVESDSDSGDVFSDIEFVALVMGEVRKGKVGLLYDFQYLKLSGDGTTDEAPPREFDDEFTIADATLALQYRLVEQPTFTLDGFGGLRAFYTQIELDVDAGGASPAQSGDGDKSWIDPIIGVKARYRMGDKWALNGYGDVGGFGVGSDLTYQLMGTVSYSFNETLTLHGGYRAFSVNFEDGDDYKFEATMHGPIVGLTFSF